MRIILDGKAMTDRNAAHDHLAERLGFPDWYGRNLDALYDLLTENGAEREILLVDPEAVTEQLGKYGEAMLSVLQEAAEENLSLTIALQ